MKKALTVERAGVADISRARGSTTMMGRDGERLVEWLTEVFQLHSDDRPVVIYLKHVTPNRRLGDKLGTIQLKMLAPEQRDAESAPEMAHMIWAKAENYASGLGGAAQQFAVQAYYEDDPAESETSCFFWIKVGHQSDLGIDSAPPNEQGVLKLVMSKLDRLEDSFCDLMEGSATMMRCMREQLSDMHQQSVEDRKERRENEEAVRKAKLEQLDRAEQRESAKAHRETQRELVDTVKTVGLAVARKWGGIDVRDTTSPGTKQLMIAFESLARDEGRFMEILAKLNDVERANFMEWWHGQLETLEQLKTGKAPEPATPAVTPPATPPADQIATAKAQAQQWAAVAAALEAEAASAEKPVAPTEEKKG